MMILMLIEGALIALLVYVIWNLRRKLITYEDWTAEFASTVESVERNLSIIDRRGSFESDDETGVIYQQIHQQVDRLIDLGILEYETNNTNAEENA